MAAPREGQRCIGAAPQGHWNATTFVAGLRYDRLTAPMVADGPMDGGIVSRLVRQFLCPTMQPGDQLIMDNLSSHKVAGCEKPSPPAAPRCTTSHRILRT